MPYHIKLNSPIGGIAANSVQSGPQGGQVGLISSEFTHIGHGMIFLNRLENICQIFFDKLPEEKRLLPSVWDHMLAIINKEGEATVYLNELQLRWEMIAKRKVKPGPISLLDDVAAIARVHIPDVEIPPEAGVVFLYSLGWNKGLLFDLSPLNQPYPPRDFDIREMMAFYINHMRLQEQWTLTSDDWRKLYEARWFPFIAMKYERTRGLIDHVRNGFDLTAITYAINADLIPELPEKLESWRSNVFFEGHLGFLEKAMEAHTKGDYVVSTALLYPHIEGIMKRYHAAVKTDDRNGQTAMIHSVTGKLNHPEVIQLSYLAPDFAKFLSEVYFGETDKGNAEMGGVSRNSVAHGMAAFEEHTLKTSLLGLLIVDQLSYFLRPKPAPFNAGNEDSDSSTTT